MQTRISATGAGDILKGERVRSLKTVLLVVAAFCLGSVGLAGAASTADGHGHDSVAKLAAEGKLRPAKL